METFILVELVNGFMTWRVQRIEVDYLINSSVHA